MCEYQIYNPNEKEQFPTCEITNELCTFCILGNAKTYNEAKEAESKLQASYRQIKDDEELEAIKRAFKEKLWLC